MLSLTITALSRVWLVLSSSLKAVKSRNPQAKGWSRICAEQCLGRRQEAQERADASPEEAVREGQKGDQRAPAQQAGAGEEGTLAPEAAGQACPCPRAAHR